MKDRNIRSQIAYCLRYIHNKDNFRLQRDCVEDFSYLLTGDQTLDSIEYFCKENDIDLKSMNLEGWSGEDCDGRPENGIRVYTYRKQTDKEYFDSICEYILPTKYQQEQYEKYLQLKIMFES